MDQPGKLVTDKTTNNILLYTNFVPREGPTMRVFQNTGEQVKNDAISKSCLKKYIVYLVFPSKLGLFFFLSFCLPPPPFPPLNQLSKRAGSSHCTVFLILTVTSPMFKIVTFVPLGDGFCFN